MPTSAVSEVQLESLLAAAGEVLEHAWSPYSGLRVGAALLCADGSVSTGCNVENASFGLTLCAERAAVAAAVAANRRTFQAIAIVSDGGRPPLPCGACRQVLAEFAPRIRVVACGARGERVDSDLGELLPRPFTSGELPGDGA